MTSKSHNPSALSTEDAEGCHSHHHAGRDAPPPSYSINNNNSISAQDPQDAPPDYNPFPDSATTVQAATVKFPPAINGYWQWKLTRTILLGPSAEQKLFAVSTHSRILSSRMSLTLHDGPSDKHPPLASLESDALRRRRPFIVTITASPETRIEITGNPARKYDMAPPFPFSCHVGGGEKGPIQEDFEWRRSYGNEVKELAHHAPGWKLVRLAQRTSDGGKRAERELGSSSDGREVVAVLAMNSSMSMTKGMRFSFLGSGLTGVMGEDWEITAVMSAVQLFQLDVQAVAEGTAKPSQPTSASAASALPWNLVFFIFRGDARRCQRGKITPTIMDSLSQLTAVPRNPQRPCWECRRRRLVCDFSVPECNKCRAAGVDCPGYGDKKPLKWLAPGKVRSRNRRRKCDSPTRKDSASSTTSSSSSSASSSSSNSSSSTTASTPDTEDFAQTPLICSPNNQLWRGGLLPLHNLSTETCAIVQAACYYNHCVYPDYLPMHQLAPSSYAALFPLSALHIFPVSICHTLVYLALSHYIHQLPPTTGSSDLVDARSRVYHHRGAAIAALTEEIGKITTRASEATITSVLMVLFTDARQFPSIDWRHHFSGAMQLMKLRGGLETLFHSTPFLRPALLYFVIVGVMGNTTSPPSQQILLTQYDNLIPLIREMYGEGLFPGLLCPPQLFINIAMINQLRYHAGNIQPVDDALRDTAGDLLEEIEAFSPQEWAESNFCNQEDWFLLASIYQSAVIIYCIASMQSLSILPLTAEMNATRAAHGHSLISLLHKAVQLPQMNKCMLWPLVVAGMEMAHGSPISRDFVAEQLSTMSQDLGTPISLSARTVLKMFWASGTSGWDDCFDRPRIIADQGLDIALYAPQKTTFFLTPTYCTTKAMDISTLLSVVSCIAVYLLTKPIYRLYFHPLRKIPGPKLTAATFLYEFYYDVILGGQFIFQVEKMHQKYGPIVRINPREVHIIDHSFYDEIYASSMVRRDKDSQFVPVYGLPESVLSTVGHDHHRFRRNLLNSFFSKRSVLELSPLIQERVEKLMQRFEAFYRSPTQPIVQLDNAYAALTSDIITTYSYGKSWHFLEDETFRSDIRQAVTDLITFWHIGRFFPLIITTLQMIPVWALALLQPGKANLFKFQAEIYEQSIGSVQQGEEKPGLVRQNIYNNLADPSVPAPERSPKRLQDEGTALLGAGTETTSRVLSLASYYLASNRDVLERLRAELRQIMPTPTDIPSWTELEKLPYLNGVVFESLRLADSVVSRLPRISPVDPLQYKDYTIPPGTPMSASSYFMHRDAEVFPNPEKFDPERWVRSAEEGTHLTRYLVAFTRGTRVCLGMNLAYMELYTTIAAVARRFDWELHDTTPDDIRVTGDMAVGYTRRGELKVYARITGLVQD
ncbi:hypothetical protein FE257_007462 [Aspergillus nanangensis]|uniref:Zn(2)-C6 fungal-type domain-containing protein n=1 Tax=Aspergillus nanangensis TaxID=2582783 RepID=A0AAD4CPK5_ASPNN|nr:hypothetical protein FE257_007462 [Aspergillus nanangensis]